MLSAYTFDPYDIFNLFVNPLNDEMFYVNIITATLLPTCTQMTP